MRETELARCFEEHRRMLRAVGHRMLGSVTEADDAVQETWLRLARTDDTQLTNLAGWLRTTLTRICLDLLRSRAARREDPGGPVEVPERSPGPADEAELADTVGAAVLVVLDTLTPAERVAFVLHDMFGVPFTEIGRIVERTPVTAKKLASRARAKVRGVPVLPAAELARHHRVVTAFLAAARSGDLDAILAVLAPDVVRRADPAALPEGMPAELRGARPVAEGTVLLGGRARDAEPALVDGRVGVLVAPAGRLRYALTFDITGDTLAAYQVIADPRRLRTLRLALLPGSV